MSKTALIFGVTGQDGSYLAEHLLGLGYHVIGVRRRTSVPNTGRVDHLAGEPRFKLICGDVTDAASVSQVVWQAWQKACMEWKRSLQTDPQAGNTPRLEVYNLAAQSQVKVSFDEPLHTTQATYLGCLNILEAIRRLDVRKEHVRFYQASSSEMFGAAFDTRARVIEKCSEGAIHWKSMSLTERERYQDESTPFLPCSPYAIAKLAAHHAVRLYRDAYGLFACSGILFNHESERRGEEFVTRKITKYVARWARGQVRRAPPARQPGRQPGLGARRGLRAGHAPHAPAGEGRTTSSSAPARRTPCGSSSWPRSRRPGWRRKTSSPSRSSSTRPSTARPRSLS
jgi:GDPmannose 4,6-dehydratase